MGKDTEKRIALSVQDDVLADALEAFLSVHYTLLRDDGKAEYDLRLVDHAAERNDGRDLAVKIPLRAGVLLDMIGQFFARQEAASLKQVLTIGKCRFIPAERILRLKSGSGEASLTEKEADILLYLYNRTGENVTRAELLENVWKYNAAVNTRTLETHIYRLRQKIQALSGEPLIETGEEGYIFTGNKKK
ncbi:MAG: winged helix-turn-helix transcriptional regulator [Pseudomonadota bacterium]|jgi:DNA-binding response OmpR family regulator|nr:winged helix family transcriptional regulator [Pseudomonadota bacterium]QKK05432.1 MAG: winged helix-turn-helix transcriptional regulator [Pseudomonadota bacterium]